MARFLCFRLHGPLAAWGDIAVGDRRPTWSHPSRSAILGLIAGALGLRRDSADELAALDRALGFASRTDSAGELLIDFHTAQAPHEKRLREEGRAARRGGVPWHRPPTRRAELDYRSAELDTMLSQREYRADGLWTVALWIREDESPPWSLEDLRRALLRPCFVPYLGRKSCVLDLPMEPQIVEANDPASAMAAAAFGTDAIVSGAVRRNGRRTVQWEGSWAGLEPEHTSRRRDRVLVRARWQFTEREEHWRRLSDPRGGNDVPEQD